MDFYKLRELVYSVDGDPRLPENLAERCAYNEDEWNYYVEEADKAKEKLKKEGVTFDGL